MDSIGVRIGLMRHFPVEEGLPTGWRNSLELQAWQEKYDVRPVEVGSFDLGGVDWKACLSSDLPRAMTTAQTVFHGKIESTDLLREGRLGPFRTGRLRLPPRMWRWLWRFAWMTGHSSQRACRDEFRARVLAAANRLCQLKQDTLVVSHAGMMAYLSAELRRRGFAGPKLRIAEHARVYVYAKG